jgi:hypothetical protein
MSLAFATGLFRLDATHRAGGCAAESLNNRNGNTHRLHGRAIA